MEAKEVHEATSPVLESSTRAKRAPTKAWRPVSRRSAIRKRILIGAVFIIALVSYPMLSGYLFRYDTASVGKWDLRYDRVENAVYIKFALLDNSPWKKTAFKSLRQAEYVIERNEREAAAETATDDLKKELQELKSREPSEADKIMAEHDRVQRMMESSQIDDMDDQLRDINKKLDDR